MVYGANDPLNRLFPFLQRMNDRRPAIVLEESIAKWQGSYGYVENVAYGIALATSDHRAINRIYNVADLEVLSEAERITKVGQVAGWQRKVVAVTKEQLPAEWELTINTEQHWYTDTTRIRQELGYKEIVPLEEAIMRTIDWERSHPPEESEQLAVPWLLDYTTEDAILADINL